VLLNHISGPVLQIVLCNAQTALHHFARVHFAVLLAQLQALARGDQFAMGSPQASPFANISVGPAFVTDAINRSTAPNAQLQQRRRTPGRHPRNGEQVRRTVYVSDLDPLVSEEALAATFLPCGPIVDCRICGDPNSTMRFGFIEFYTEESARIALSRNGALLGAYCIRVAPSKTAIIPVDRRFLPKSEEERALVARTVYVTNVHRSVQPDALRFFLENLCGSVRKVRLLGDANHDTKIAFVEFANEAAAQASLRCTGAHLGPLPIRLAPSKTPVRTEVRQHRELSTGAVAMAAAAVAAAATVGLQTAASDPLMLTHTQQDILSLLTSSDQRAATWAGPLPSLGLTQTSSLPLDMPHGLELSLPSVISSGGLSSRA
jgi:hypothetical protein